MKTIILSIAAVLVLGGLAYFYTYDTEQSSPQEVFHEALTIAEVPEILRGMVMHIPVDTKTVDITLDSYVSGNAVVLGGVSTEEEDVVTVFIPEFTDTLSNGAWGIAQDNYLLVPTYINFGGVGQFFMVALFVYNEDSQSFTHQDLHFVNDRIAFDGMVQNDNNMVSIMYRTHAEGEAMTDEPTLPATRVLRIKGNKLELIE